MMEWDYLRVVLAVHRGGSMAGAAEQLGVDRATVQRRLDALEAQLKSRLFDRRPDGCVLTPAGRNVIGLIERVEQAMTALAHRVEGEDQAAAGTVKLAGPQFLIEAVIAPAIPTLRELYPGLELDLRTDHDSLDLARGEADIALRYVRPANEALVARRIGSVGVGLFASDAYVARRGMPGANFAGHDLLLLEGPIGNLPAMGWLFGQMQDANIPLRSDDVSSLAAGLCSGAGIACIPAIAVDGLAGIVPVPPGIVGRFDIYLATHRDLRERARVRSVYDFVVRLFSQRAASLSGDRIARSLGSVIPPAELDETVEP
jgi:DNA-binding transcriptional LysR family regulator